MPRNFPSEWSIGDLVDLEYFLFQDAEADGSELARRDRAWYLAHLSDQERPLSRRLLLRRWLELRRAAARDQGVHSPGEVIAAVLRPARLLLFFSARCSASGWPWECSATRASSPSTSLPLSACWPFCPFCSCWLPWFCRWCAWRGAGHRPGAWVSG
ncbi:hypothetical protein [Geoalkalibacter halelectricus]|uniref:hypothetical protein n=1 Tax=Geoalkalibacter halelectricus TaxID=2847045 RepID=UPI00266E9A54|nr:hypothetical protein [Geoalkalibacter halelectricus]MDO3377230.1 hypothetical protein [Geoalkalibacter halelectricus]